MSQETITLIIGAIIGSVSPLLILLVTLYFQNKREIRARKWELEDRHWNRRLSVWIMRVKEARDFVDTWETVVHVLLKFYMAYTEGRKTGSVRENLDEIGANFGDLPSLFYGASRQVTSLTLLGDKELSALNSELVGTLNPDGNTVLELVDRIFQNSSIEDDELETLLQVIGKSRRLVALMKIRLDGLDQQ